MAIEEVISAQAVARYIRMSPTKVRRVLNQIRGCTYEEALIILEFLRKSLSVFFTLKAV